MSEQDPAAPAAPEVPSGEAAPAANLESEFAGLGQEFDDMEVSTSLPSESEAGGAQPSGATPSVPEKPPGQQPPLPPGQAPPAQAAPKAAPPAEGQQEQPVAPASLPAGPRALVDQLSQHRGDILNELAGTRFAWDAGEQKQFQADLESDASQALVNWVPRLMSRMYYESAVMTLNHISQFVPTLMANYTRLLDQQKEAESTFFKQFPQLNKKAHWSDITTFANMFGRQNPQLSQADLLALVGSAVMAKHNLAGAAGVNGAPRRPSTPPFVPAQAGGASPVRVATEPETPWAGLGGYYDES